MITNFQSKNLANTGMEVPRDFKAGKYQRYLSVERNVMVLEVATSEILICELFLAKPGR